MINRFAPPKKEILVTAKITAKEAQLLKILRTINYGKVSVQKAEGQLIRVEPSESIMLTEEAGIALISGNEFDDALIDKPVVSKK